MSHIEEEAFHPGGYLKDELDKREWTQTELAEMIGRPLRMVNQIIAGKAGITAQTAQQLAAAFGTSAELWMNLQSQYDLANTEINQAEIADKAKFRETFPFYQEMVKRGWIQAVNDITARARAMRQWFERSPVFAAKTQAALYGDYPLVQQAWVMRARAITEKMPVPTTFDAACKAPLLAQLETMLDDEARVAEVATLLPSYGIRLLYLQALKGAKIDGACFWLDEENPVIAMSLRLDRIDNFWFVLRHELEHVFNGDGQSAETVDELQILQREDTENLPAHEQQANAAAADFCVPQAALQAYCARYGGNVFQTSALETFARDVRRHKGLIVGQLHHQTGQWKMQRRVLTPVGAIARANPAYCEGWDM